MMTVGWSCVAATCWGVGGCAFQFAVVAAFHFGALLLVCFISVISLAHIDF